MFRYLTDSIGRERRTGTKTKNYTDFSHLTSPLPLVNGGDLIDQGRPTTPLRRFFDWSSDQVEEEALVHVVPPPLGLTLSLDSI